MNRFPAPISVNPIHTRQQNGVTISARIAGGIAIGCAFTLVLAFGGVQPQWYLPVYGMLYATTAAGLILALLGRLPVQWNWIFILLLAILGLPLAQLALHTTVNPSATETGFLHLLAGACAFWLASIAATDTGFRRAWLLLMAAACGILGGWDIFQFFLFPHHIWGIVHVTTNMPMGPFVNRDDFAACIELLFPAALALAMRPRREIAQSLAWGLAAALGFASVVLCASRGGAIGIALELGLFWLWWRHKNRQFITSNSPQPHTGELQADAMPSATIRQKKTASRPWSWMLLAIAGLLFVYAYAAGYTHLLARLPSTGISAQARLELDHSSLAMGIYRPVLGWGWNTWKYVYPRFASFDDGDIYDYAHSDWMQWWAESGLLGTLCLAAMAALFLRRIRAKLRRQNQFNDFDFALIAGLTAFLLHATADFIFHIPGLLLLFTINAGMIITLHQPCNN